MKPKPNVESSPSSAPFPPDHPRVVIFPPVLPLGGFLLGFILEWLFPLAGKLPPFFPPARQVLAAVLIPAGVALMAVSRRAMTRAGTNVSPRLPSLQLVQQWPFGWTRNPMYLGGNLALLGLGLAFQLAWVGVLFPFLVTICHYGVVLREEEYLSRKFGPAYLDYQARVRRWL